MKTPLATLVLLALTLMSGHGQTPFTQLFYTDGSPTVEKPSGLTEFHSIRGVLEIDLTAGYDRTDPSRMVFPFYPYTAVTGKTTDDPFPRLAYSCKYTNSPDAPVTSYAGPFLRVFPGDRVIIHFTNALHTQRTNLHFHGMAVTPRQASDNNDTYGDYVGLPFVNATAPGTDRLYNFLVPKEQRPGLYWYHAHAHGVAENQVGNGLGGPIFVEGVVPEFLAAWSAKVKTLAEPKVADSLIAQVSEALPKLQHHILVLKDYVTPYTFPYYGPYEQSVNGKITFSIPTKEIPKPVESAYWINSDGSKQIWSISNESADLYYLLRFHTIPNGDQPFEVISRDGGPDNFAGPFLGSPETTLMIPPSSRVTAIVPTDKLGGRTASVIVQPVTTGLGTPKDYAIPPQFNDYYFQRTGNNNPGSPVIPVRTTPWRIIDVHPSPGAINALAATTPMPSVLDIPLKTGAKIAAVSQPPIDASYIFFAPGSIEPPPNAKPVPLPQENSQNLTFYKYFPPSQYKKQVKNPVDPYDSYEPAIATLVPGVAQRWIVQNATSEWHVFHIHQIQFKVDYFTTVNLPYDQKADPVLSVGRPKHNYTHPFYSDDLPPPSGLKNGDPLYAGLQDTVSIPPYMQVVITLPMTEGTHKNDPIAGKFVMHCHILGHEDAGMMANIEALKAGQTVADYKKALREEVIPHTLSPRELASVRTDRPLKLADATGKLEGREVFSKTDYSLVTFGFTHCDGSCPVTTEKCLAALSKLPVAEKNRIAPYFVSLDPTRDGASDLAAYAKMHDLPDAWNLLVDTDLAGIRAFGVKRELRTGKKGESQIWHTSVVYVVDRDLNIRAAFDADDSSEVMAAELGKLLSAKPGTATVKTTPKRTMTGVELTMQN